MKNQAIESVTIRFDKMPNWLDRLIKQKEEQRVKLHEGWEKRQLAAKGMN